jgi:hypothetical protein
MQDLDSVDKGRVSRLGSLARGGNFVGIRSIASAWLAAVYLVGCSGGSDGINVAAESCMVCHNGATHDDYSGPGIENPHPFTNSEELACSTCHGGNPDGDGQFDSHVPAPPEIGKKEDWAQDAHAYFNRLTLTGIDKFPDYTVDGKTYTALDYLQFINPGDLRVVTDGRSCGKCHQGHAECVEGSLSATTAGVLSGALYAIGVDNDVAASQGLYEDTAADKGFRAVVDVEYPGPSVTGAVPELLEFPVISVHGEIGPELLYKNDNYQAEDLPNDILPDGRVATGSNLERLYHEQVAFTCGDCHLGSAGANNRYGDFRSSGCTACHMPYGLDGRTKSSDPNIAKNQPIDPDDIDPPERAHVRTHQIRSVARKVEGGATFKGIDDYTCAGCHQGSNRTVMQYWGIRLDQNQDVKKGFQYPANPVSFKTTKNDARLFDPVVKNKTFNGRNPNQYLLFEDYDGDGRDDTPADVHHDAGMGCIDCHGSHDLHGGDVTQPEQARTLSRLGQGVAIRCESCHGSADTYAPTVSGLTYEDTPADLAIDEEGNPLRHVTKDANGHFFLKSRLTGNKHYVVQTLDVVVDNGRTDPNTGDPLYSEKASFAMGRDDGNPATGLGPAQTGSGPNGFMHGDSMTCASCHSSWQNNCIGCHLSGEYNDGNNFSNITGQEIVFRQRDAEFIYQSPVPFQLGVSPNGKVDSLCPSTETFWFYEDRDGDLSEVITFTDRQGKGAKVPAGRRPALSHNVLSQHSIRGKVDAANEGPRYCVACHLTDDSLANWGTEYDTFRAALAPGGDLSDIDFNLLQTHIGLNPGNQLNSPFWVHMVAGMGSGLFFFDEVGFPVNPLDDNDDRFGGNGVDSPADAFDLARVFFDLDRVVEADGNSNGSSNHPIKGGGPTTLRDGADNLNMSGPLGATLIQRLIDPIGGIILDSWLDADGVEQGDLGN